MAGKHWLIKSEPSVYSIEDLARDGTTEWSGVRNYKARNYMRDEMRPGDGLLVYHSNADPLCSAGIAEVTSAAHPDSTQFRKGDPYHDPDSDRAQHDDHRVADRAIRRALHQTRQPEVQEVEPV